MWLWLFLFIWLNSFHTSVLSSKHEFFMETVSDSPRIPGMYVQWAISSINQNERGVSQGNSNYIFQVIQSFKESKCNKIS